MPRYFYHVSRRRFDTGTRLTPSGKPYLSPKIEQALEQRRPDKMLSRTQAVYLAPNYQDFRLYGQLSGYVYRVQPEGKVEGHDVHWIGELQRSAEKRDMTFPPIDWMDWTEHNLDYLCASYWWGEPSERPVWEYLAPAAVIVKVLGRNTD